VYTKARIKISDFDFKINSQLFLLATYFLLPNISKAIV